MLNFLRRVLGNGEKIAIGNKICIGIMVFFYIIIPLPLLFQSCGYEDIELAKKNELSELKDNLPNFRSTVRSSILDNESALIRKEIDTLQARLNEVTEKYKPYHAELDKRKEAEAKRQKAEAERKRRNEEFRLQFSAWDGSHDRTVKYVKEQMHNPKSFEHVETGYTDYAEKGFRIIDMKYRGTNLYGGVVTPKIWVKVDLEGNVTEVYKHE